MTPGAEDEVRTRDLQLGRLSLYQLSYFRIYPPWPKPGRVALKKNFLAAFAKKPANNCGQGWIRTTELRRGQIYSLLPLATWLLAHLLWGPHPISNVFREAPASHEPEKGLEPPTS